MPKKAIAKVDSGRADDNVVCGGHERKIAQVLKSARKKNLFLQKVTIFFLTNRYAGGFGGAEGKIHNSLKIKNLHPSDPFGVAAM
jgi:hypothetical protein